MDVAAGIVRRIRQLAAEYPDDVAFRLIGLDGSEPGFSWSWLDRRSSQLAGGLAARGTGPGDRLIGPERIVMVYGMTAGLGFTALRGDEWMAHQGSVGRGIRGTEVRILDADGKDVPAGEIGDIYLRSPFYDQSPCLGFRQKVRAQPGRGGWSRRDPNVQRGRIVRVSADLEHDGGARGQAELPGPGIPAGQGVERAGHGHLGSVARRDGGRRET